MARDERYKHDSKHFYEAIGLTEDQYEEIEFKASRYIKKDLKASERIERATAWVKERFNEADQPIASMVLGQFMERDRMGLVMSNMVKSMKTLNESMAIAFASKDDHDQFQKEFDALVKEFNGTRRSENGLTIIEFKDESKADEFKTRMNTLKEKYAAKNPNDDAMKFPFSFGGPIAQA